MQELFLEVVYRHSPMEMSLWGVLAVAIWTVAAIICKKNAKRWNLWNWFNRIVLFVTIIFIIKYTLIRESNKREISLIPFFSFSFPRASDRYNTVVANALLFLPIGTSMPFVLTSIKVDRWIKKHPIKMTIIAAVISSTLIEVEQYTFGLGLCETDDIIFNTFGTAFGTLAFIGLSYFTESAAHAKKTNIKH